jgi:anthranilate phosphoribosyltransferase
MSPRVHPQSLGRIIAQIRFGSTLNIAGSLASPCRPTHGLRGVYSKALLPKVARVMQEIGYQRAMVVHGFDDSKEKGMDELSNIGESVIHEFHPDGTENTFSLAPENAGLKRATYGAISCNRRCEKRGRSVPERSGRVGYFRLHGPDMPERRCDFLPGGKVRNHSGRG